MANIQLTQELVKSLFDYKDGFLYWKVKPAISVKIGDRAGSYHKVKNGDRWRVDFGGKTYLYSRIIFLWHHGYLPVIVDHEDRITTNNKIENLRPATRSENQKNVSSKIGSTSKYLGVHLERGKYWRSRINNGKKYEHLGNHETEEKAALAYNKAAVKYHGEFANLNIITPLI